MEVEWGVLLETLFEYSETAGGDYNIIQTGNNTFEFRWYTDQMGLDRTIRNASGNDPVIFSTSFGNLRLPSKRESRINEVNAYIVGGSGRGINHVVVTVTDDLAVEASQWNRMEGYINAYNAEDDNSVLRQIGRAELKKTVPEKTGDLEVIQTPESMMFVHYDMGDRVTTYLFGERMDRKIEGYDLSVDPIRSTIGLSFSDVIR
jgi:hypothetical protein